MEYVIKNDELAEQAGAAALSLPKYASQIINLANQNSQATRPVNVGQMSDLFTEFLGLDKEKTLGSWETWYTEKNPDAIDKASEKIYTQIQHLVAAISQIDQDMVKEWVKDLLINKTFCGLNVQRAILSCVAKKLNQPYTQPTTSDESVGIDGYIGGVPYSVKPESYKTMERLPEHIGVKIIYYRKEKDRIIAEV